MTKYESKKSINKGFPWFPGVRFEPYSQKENSKIKERLKKRDNTAIWECSLKNSWNTLQITSKLECFRQIVNHAVCSGLPGASDTFIFLK